VSEIVSSGLISRNGFSGVRGNAGSNEGGRGEWYRIPPSASETAPVSRMEQTDQPPSLASLAVLCHTLAWSSTLIGGKSVFSSSSAETLISRKGISGKSADVRCYSASNHLECRGEPGKRSATGACAYYPSILLPNQQGNGYRRERPEPFSKRRRHEPAESRSTWGVPGDPDRGCGTPKPWDTSSSGQDGMEAQYSAVRGDLPTPSIRTRRGHLERPASGLRNEPCRRRNGRSRRPFFGTAGLRRHAINKHRR